MPCGRQICQRSVDWLSRIVCALLLTYEVATREQANCFACDRARKAERCFCLCAYCSPAHKAKTASPACRKIPSGILSEGEPYSGSHLKSHAKAWLFLPYVRSCGRQIFLVLLNIRATLFARCCYLTKHHPAGHTLQAAD